MALWLVSARCTTMLKPDDYLLKTLGRPWLSGESQAIPN